MPKKKPLTLDELKKEGRSTATVREGAEVLGIGTGSAYQAVRAGQLPALRLGRKWLISVSALARMLEDEQWGPKP